MRQRVLQIASGLAMLWAILDSPWAMTQSHPGFGGSTRGGAGQRVYRVTNLNDMGPGSLRDAVSRGGRQVVFDMAGDIHLNRDIYVRGSFITIDGQTAPAPGITLRNHGLMVHGRHGAHDVIVRRIRVRDSQGCDTCSTSGAGIGISREAYNVVVDRVSVSGAQDQAIQVGKEAHDVTIQWSIFAESKNPYKKTNLPVLISRNTKRVSFHHNLVIKGYERMPQVLYSDSGAKATETQLDMRNNLMWDWVYAATQIWKGARANVVANYYYTPYAPENRQRRAIFMCHEGSKPPQCDGTNPQWFARAYVADNVSGHGPEITAYLNSLGTESKAFPASAVETTDACTAAQQVLANAGMRPLDQVDQRYIAQVSLAGCTTMRSPVRK